MIDDGAISLPTANLRRGGISSLLKIIEHSAPRARGGVLAVHAVMWMDALDDGPGARPTTLIVGNQTVVVIAITGDATVMPATHLFLRWSGEELTASLENE